MCPMYAGVKDGAVPVSTLQRVPKANVPHARVTCALCRTSPSWRHGNPSPLAGSMWDARTPHASPPLTCQLALIQVFHGLGLAKARHADVHPRGIGHFPRGSVVHHPVGAGLKVAERTTSPGDGVRITGWQLGPGWLFPSLVWMGRWAGAKPAPMQLPSVSGQGAPMQQAAVAPLPCGEGWQYLQQVLRGVWLA